MCIFLFLFFSLFNKPLSIFLHNCETWDLFSKRICWLFFFFILFVFMSYITSYKDAEIKGYLFISFSMKIFTWHIFPSSEQLKEQQQNLFNFPFSFSLCVFTEVCFPVDFHFLCLNYQCCSSFSCWEKERKAWGKELISNMHSLTSESKTNSSGTFWILLLRNWEKHIIRIYFPLSGIHSLKIMDGFKTGCKASKRNTNVHSFICV